MPRTSRVTIAALVVVAEGVGLGLLAAWVLRHIANVAVAAWYCVAVALVAAALLQLAKSILFDLETPVRPAHGPLPDQPRSRDLLAPVERRLSAASRERRLFLRGLQPVLHGVVRDRVRQRHGIDLDNALHDDPDLARRVLGDELWHWLTTADSEGKAPSPRQLDSIVTAIERL